MNTAAEIIQCGAPIRHFNGAWFNAQLSEMQAVAARPTSAQDCGPIPADSGAYQPGHEVAARKDGGILMLIAERCRAGAKTALPAETLYVTLQGGRPLGLEPWA